MTWDDLSQASLDEIVAWANDQPWCRAMANCQQDAGWHSEGDVWTHTKMVCAQLPRLDNWPTLTPHERTVLIFTALFHDSARVEEHREKLLAIRRGEMPWEEVEDWRKQLHQEFNSASEATSLPERPDYERANAFLIEARHKALSENLP